MPMTGAYEARLVVRYLSSNLDLFPAQPIGIGSRTRSEGARASIHSSPSHARVSVGLVMKASLVCLLFVLASCTHGSSLRSRSAGDLHCRAEDLRIYHLDDRSYRVIGCGLEAVYISTCDAHRNCTWVVNEAITPASASSASTPNATLPGCGSDAQCKGDRICVDRQCVAPSPPPTQE